MSVGSDIAIGLVNSVDYKSRLEFALLEINEEVIDSHNYYVN
jgi:hypothetical protein